MSFVIRHLGPTDSDTYGTRIRNGRSYTAVAGQIVDIPNFDAGIEGWCELCQVGPTSARPSGTLPPNAPGKGQLFIDTTLNAVIVWDGATWRDPLTGAAV